MIGSTPQVSQRNIFFRHFVVGFKLAAALLIIAIAGLTTLANIIVLGPTTPITVSRIWALGFLACSAGTAAWWAGYLWLLRSLSGWDWQECIRKSTVLSALLSLTIVPDFVVCFSGILPYTFVFDTGARSLYISILLVALAGVAAGQELALLHAARPCGLGKLAMDIWRFLNQLPTRIAGLPMALPRLARNHPLLTIILFIGTVQRLVEMNTFHGGDMNVMLSVTYSILTPPPFDYYHDYRPQPWVYNHFPLFPLLLAPSYWVFENLFHLPTVWAAKVQSGIADAVLAILLYRSAKQTAGGNLALGNAQNLATRRLQLLERLFTGNWVSLWGSALAAIWFLAPWVVTADDHAVGMTAVFVVGSIAAVERGWLSGMLLALGLATRNEAAFFLFPMAVHFLARRRLGQTVAFFGAFVTTLALVTAPFILTDPEAVDYALRKHTENIGSEQVSALLALIQPHLAPDLATLLQQKPEILAIGLNVLIALLAFRDPHPERVLIVAAAGYVMTLPIVHQRYIVFLCSLGLFYAGKFRAPLVAALVAVATWPGLGYGPYAMNLLFVALIIVGLLRVDKPNPVVSLNQNGWRK